MPRGLYASLCHALLVFFKITVVRYLIFEKLNFLSSDVVQNGPTRHLGKFCCNNLKGCIKWRLEI